MTATDFIGRGFKFPMGIDQTGRVALAAGPDNIASSIHMILMTAPGERLMRPEFGCAIWDQLFDSINHTTLALAAHSVEEALSQWEPRIEVDSVDVSPEEEELGRLRISVTYRIRNTNDVRNLVFPFYMIPGEGSA